MTQEIRLNNNTYLLEDSIINKGDWTIMTSNNGKEMMPFQMLSDTSYKGKKIISTTDKTITL
jgi:uncharacterized phosphosugar-binding protein